MADQRASIEILAEVDSAIKEFNRLVAAFFKGAQKMDTSLDSVESDELVSELERAGKELDELGFGAVDASRKVTAAFKGSDKDLRKAAKAADRFEKELKQVGRAGARTKRQISGLRSSLGLLTAALGGFSLKAFASEAKDVAIQFDGLERASLAVFESQEKAAEAMAFSASEAERLGQNTLVLSEAFVDFSAAAKGTVLEGDAADKIFSRIVETMTILGKSTNDTESALLAIRQIMSKGKITAEELRNQLGERMPGALLAMERALGVTGLELDKMLEQGKVGIENLVPFAEELVELFGEGLASALESDRAKLERLNNKGIEFKRIFGAAFVDDLTEGMERFADSLGDSAESAQVLGNFLGLLIREALGLVNVVSGLVGLIGGVWVGALLLAARAVVGLGEAMARILPGFDKTEEALKKSREDIELLIQASAEFVKSSAGKVKQGALDMAAGFEALGDAAKGAGAKVEELGDEVETLAERNQRLIDSVEKTKIEIQGLGGSIGGVPIAAYVAKTEEAAEATKKLAKETVEAADAFEDIQERILKANEAAAQLEKEAGGAAGGTGELAGELSALEDELTGLKDKTFLTIEEMQRLGDLESQLTRQTQDLFRATRDADAVMTEFGAGSAEAAAIVDEFAAEMFLTEEQLKSFGESTSEAIRRQRLFGDETEKSATEQEKLAARIEKVEKALVDLEERLSKSFSEGLKGADEYIEKLGQIDSLLEAIVAKLDQVK